MGFQIGPNETGLRVYNNVNTHQIAQANQLARVSSRKEAACNGTGVASLSALATKSAVVEVPEPISSGAGRTRPINVADTALQRWRQSPKTVSRRPAKVVTRSRREPRSQRQSRRLTSPRCTRMLPHSQPTPLLREVSPLALEQPHGTTQPPESSVNTQTLLDRLHDSYYRYHRGPGDCRS